MYRYAYIYLLRCPVYNLTGTNYFHILTITLEKSFLDIKHVNSAPV